MIRCIRLWTGDDDNSHFEEGVIDLSKGERGDILSDKIDVVSISFRETGAGGAFEGSSIQTGGCAAFQQWNGRGSKPSRENEVIS
jgi:hypothetical protein